MGNSTRAGRLRRTRVRLVAPLLAGALMAMPAPGAAPPPDSAAASSGFHPVEILSGSDPACETVRGELAGHWQGHGFDEEPQWKDTDFVVPRELGDAEEADVDFYNDGKLSRVLINYYSSQYMTGSSLLVQHGRSAERVDLAVSDPLEDPDAWFIPCQLQGRRFPLRECPPFSQQNDDVGLTVSWAERSRHVHFVGRYSDLALVRLHDTTFIVVTGSSPEALGYAAVLKPLPTRTFSTTCVLQRH